MWIAAEIVVHWMSALTPGLDAQKRYSAESHDVLDFAESEDFLDFAEIQDYPDFAEIQDFLDFAEMQDFLDFAGIHDFLDFAEMMHNVAVRRIEMYHLW